MAPRERFELSELFTPNNFQDCASSPLRYLGILNKRMDSFVRRTLSNLRVTVPTFILLRATPEFVSSWQFLLSTTGIFSAFPRIGTERAFVYSYLSRRGGIRTHSPNGNGFTVRRSSPTLPPSDESPQTDSNRQPTDYKSVALPIAPWGQDFYFFLYLTYIL